MLLNGNYCKPIAIFDTVYLELNCNDCNEWFFNVADIRKDDSFRTFYIGTSLEYPCRFQAAYEQAARHYNTLVPDAECIPLF